MTVLKTSFRKTAPKEIYYRDYNEFNADNFKTELKQNFAISSSDYENFEKAFKGTNITKITLLDNNKVISDDKELCKTFG